MLRQFKPTSISQKILAYIFVISSVFTLAITILQLSFDYHQEVKALEKSLGLVERSYSKSITSSLWELNDFQIQTQLDGITSVPGVQYVTILYKDRLVASSGVMSENTISKSIDLIHFDKFGKGTFLGKFVIYGNLDNVWEKIYSKIFIIFISQLFKTMLVSFLIYFSIQKLVTRHLVHISSFVKDLNIMSDEKRLILDRKKAVSSEVENDDELDILVDSINSMREKLSASYQDLNKLNRELEEKVEVKTLQVLQQNRRLEYSSRMSSLGEMAGGIAHEINNPIMIIKTASNLLKKLIESGDTDINRLNNFFDKIDKTTDRITKIIHGLLTLSRDTSNENCTLFQMSDVLGDVLALCAERFKAHGILIKINLEDEAFKVQTYGRRIQYSQVLLNLMHNSFDAIEHLEERWVSITCDYKAQEKKIIVRVTDSGHGIPQDIQDKVMQPFFTTKEVGKGTGLGLSLSMAIIKNHNGEFYIDHNAPNTTFVIVLPTDIRNFS